MTNQPVGDDPFVSLTWADLDSWAGSRIVGRGKSYDRRGCVQQLAKHDNITLVAWVDGTHRYATSVTYDCGELRGQCTCPYLSVCKHAVAVVLAYLQGLEDSKHFPLAADDDPRFELLRDGHLVIWDDDDERDRLDQEAADSDEAHHLGEYLGALSKSELVELAISLARQFPEVHTSLEDRRRRAIGSTDELVGAARRAIREVTAEPVWTDRWSGEGPLPDYTRVLDQMAALRDRGLHDEVVELGRELYDAGIAQIEQSHDEGETIDELAECMGIVFEALVSSNLSEVDQILWAVDVHLRDEFSVLQDEDFFLDASFSTNSWNEAAERLNRRLESIASSGDGQRYKRDRTSNWLVEALQRAGRQGEVIPLLEREAPLTFSFPRLVQHLIAVDRTDDAIRWIHKGIGATGKRLPGVARRLRTHLEELREREGNPAAVAALRADDFFNRPSAKTYHALQEAAQTARVWDAVRDAAIVFLETGTRPERQSEKGANLPAWPLPTAEVCSSSSGGHRPAPHYDVLINVAIHENRPEQVLHWYDKRGVRRPDDHRIAHAIAELAPDRAIEIWRRAVDGEIARTKPRAYQVAAGFLRRIRQTLRNHDREAEWYAYLDEVRARHRRKRRLLDILDGLERKPIISTLEQ